MSSLGWSCSSPAGSSTRGSPGHDPGAAEPTVFVGHFGLAAGVKAQTPAVPLWALFVASQLLDLIYIAITMPLGLESLQPVDPSHPNAYGGLIIHASYTHSLVGAALIAVVAALLTALRWGLPAGSVIGLMVFSHWVLDLVVHRPDMPIVPGNAGDLPLLGFGLWQVPVAAAITEGILAVSGGALYWRAATRLPARSAADRRMARIAAGAVAGLLILTLVTSVLPRG